VLRKSTNVDLLTCVLVRIPSFNILVIDRLYDTMEDRIIKWEKLQKRIGGGIRAKIFDRNGAKKLSLLDDKLVAAFDLSAAILFLHNRNILYRDLKPGTGKRCLMSKRGRAHWKLMSNFAFSVENIGFDIRDDVKLFDFGLAKEVHLKDRDANGLFNLTAMTGSLRYMAPGKWKRGKDGMFTHQFNKWCLMFFCQRSLWKSHTVFHVIPTPLQSSSGRCIPAGHHSSCLE
jgi:serine/threonine protein kinase